jgi:hypothetical protein
LEVYVLFICITPFPVFEIRMVRGNMLRENPEVVGNMMVHDWSP